MKLISVFLMIALAATAQTVDYPFVIKPLAGTSSLGNGLAATQALLRLPIAGVPDSTGGFAILDSGNRQIRRVASSGIIASVVSVDADCTDMKVGRDGAYYLASSALVFKVTAEGKKTIIAGTGVPGNSRDGGQATAGPIDAQVAGIALDSNDNVYFVEASRVRKVTPAGIITTVAGTTTSGYSGDNGPAINAQLNYPRSLAFDAANNLYIPDTSNYRVRRVDTNGNITTIAGNSSYGPAVNGKATSSPLEFPYGISVDAFGNVFFTDSGANSLLKIDSASGVLSVLAGGGTPSFADGPSNNVFLDGPAGVGVESNGSILFTELSSNRVRRFSSGNVRTVAGRVRMGGDNGPATEAPLNSPIGVSFDKLGNLFIADAEAHQVRKVTLDGLISTVAGTGLAGSPAPGAVASASAIPRNLAVAVDSSGNVFVAASKVVYRISPNGVINIYAGTETPGSGGAGDGGPAVRASFTYISGLAVDSANNLYIGDHANNRVRKVSAADGTISAFAGTGMAGLFGDNGPASAAQLRGFYSMSLAVDGKNNVYINDDGNHRVRMVSPAGVISTVAGNGQAGDPDDGVEARNAPLNLPTGLAVDSAGVIYIATTVAQYFGNHTISRIEGGIIRAIGGRGTVPVADDLPALTTSGFDAHGMKSDANGDLVVTDYSGGVVRKLMRNSPRELVASEGNNQSAPPFAALPKPLRVQLNGRAGPGVAGEPVTFKVTAGDATLSGASVPTDDTGAALVAVTLGAAGPVIVTATAAGLSPVSFNATATAGLTVTPETLAFSYTIGADLPKSQQIAVSGFVAPIAAAAAVDGDVAWLAAETVDGGVTVSIVNLDQLLSGVYNGNVTISADGMDSRVVPVLLTVSDLPVASRRLR